MMRDLNHRIAPRSLRWGWACRLTLLMITCLSVTISPSSVWADSNEGVMKKLKEKAAVRYQFKMRDHRTELGFMMSSSLGDVYNRNLLFGFQAQRYLSDSFGVGLHGFFGLSIESALAERIRGERPKRVTSDAFSSVGVGGALEAIYVPAFGKFSLLGVITSRYDLHLTGGVGMVQVSGDAFDSFALAPTVGVGSRFFINQNLAINLQVRDYFYKRAENVIPLQEKDESWRNHFFLTLSVSFFLGEPSIGD